MSAEGRPDEDLAPAGEAGNGVQSETASGAGEAPHQAGGEAANEASAALSLAEGDASFHDAGDDTLADHGEDALADARAFADSVLAGLEQAGLLAGGRSERAESRFATSGMGGAPSPMTADGGSGEVAPEDDHQDARPEAFETSGPGDVFAADAVEAGEVDDTREPGAATDADWGAAIEVEPDAVFARSALFPGDVEDARSAGDDADFPAAQYSGGDDDGGEDPELYDSPLAAEKHDALADAVQAALLAVYGGQGYAQVGAAQGGGASLFATGLDSEPEDPLPSAEDVILSYFQYTSQAQSEADVQEAAQPETPPPYRNGRGTSAPAGAQAAASSYSGMSQPRFDSQAMPNVSYAAPSAAAAAAAAPPLAFANLPVPAPMQETEIRANSKLLGAAGLGLIGGIAFAAVMAVFLINSMEPEEQPQAAAIRPPAIAPQPAAPPPAPARPEVVAADVAGGPGATVPLNIEVRALPRNEQTLVSITGIPAGGRLNSGVDAGGGNWLLPPRRLNGLTLSLPAEVSGPVEIGVEILDSNVRVPLSEKRTFTVALNAGAAAPQDVASAPPVPPQPQAVPATAPQNAAPLAPAAVVTQQLAALSGAPSALPDAVPPSIRTPVALPQTAGTPPMPAGDVQDLIREGNRYMRDGDILRAREYYELAVRSGNAEAALAMGRSFDPSYFDRLDLKTGEPDPAKAFEWYREAMNAGLDRAAQVRIENLRRFLNR